MGKNYTKKTNRFRRKLHKLPEDAVQADIAGGTATFQMVLPMNELMAEVADAIEETASQAGLLMMKAMIDDEVSQLVGPRYAHDQQRQAFRWGKEEGHVIFAGHKAAIEKPRVRSKEGREVPLTGNLCRNVKQWRNANMAWRWGGAVLLEARSASTGSSTIARCRCS